MCRRSFVDICVGVMYVRACRLACLLAWCARVHECVSCFASVASFVFGPRNHVEVQQSGHNRESLTVLAACVSLLTLLWKPQELVICIFASVNAYVHQPFDITMAHSSYMPHLGSTVLIRFLPTP